MKKRYAFIACILIVVYLLVIFKSVNFNIPEFRLSIKTILRQELTLEEMKSSSIYKAYNLIDHDTNVEEINDVLDKKSKNIYKHFESWYYPYGYLSIWYRENEKSRVFVKTVSFDTPYTAKLTEKELYSVFQCNSLEEIVAILGEPAILGKTYDESGEVTDSRYEWGIETRLSEKFIEDVKRKYDKYVSFPLSYSFPLNFNKRPGKLRLSVTIEADKIISKFSLDDNRKRL